MPMSPPQLDVALRKIDAAVLGLSASHPSPAIERWRADAAATSFHLRRDPTAPPIVVVLGGTGTGKSTLVNRLVGQTVTATSFRRTYTAGPVAVTADPRALPAGWLGLAHEPATTFPARGRDNVLTTVTPDANNSGPNTLIDTPDLDGDTPAHHAQADRAFRWATALLFVVTPEKYQMTELLAYYRLARRYGVPAVFAMNKCEERAVLDDYRRLLAEREWPDARVFAVPRDDAAFEPAAAENLDALRAAVGTPAGAPSHPERRVADVLQRLQDQVAAPARDARRAVDALTARLAAMETAPPGVDVNPITQQLQRRLQQRSVLYLIGPQRVLDRVRQVPALLARLPRATWDYLATGELPARAGNGAPDPREVPDFRAVLVDQFNVVRSRVDDVLRDDPTARAWVDDPSYAATRFPDDAAGTIADEELAGLREWLERRWNADPRDTRVLRKVLKALPGGQKLTQWSEAAPYLLAVVLATHHAFFGPVDLVVLGGYGLATWLTERLGNEVAARTRQANRAIADRFTALAHEQIARVTQWLGTRAAAGRAIDDLAAMADDLQDQCATMAAARAGARAGA